MTRRTTMKIRTCFAGASRAPSSAPWLPRRGRTAGELSHTLDNPAVEKRIDDGIEKNRKGDAVLTIVDAAGKPWPTPT